MTADLVKCLSISVPILLRDDSRLGQMSVYFCAKFYWQLTADLVKCLSISVPILLTDDSRLGQMYVFFCTNSTGR